MYSTAHHKKIHVLSGVSGARTGERLLWQPLCFLPQPPDQATAHARARPPCSCPSQHPVFCGENTLCTFAPTMTAPAFVPYFSVHMLPPCCEQPACLGKNTCAMTGCMHALSICMRAVSSVSSRHDICSNVVQHTFSGLVFLLLLVVCY